MGDLRCEETGRKHRDGKHYTFSGMDVRVVDAQEMHVLLGEWESLWVLLRALQQPCPLTCLLLGHISWKCSTVSALAEVEKMHRNSEVLCGLVFPVCGTSLTQGY